MAFVKINARSYKVYVQDPAQETRFVRIQGLNSIGIAPSAEETDDTDFDSNGFEEVVISQRGSELTLEGNEKVDMTTGDYQEGQALINAYAEEVGEASRFKIRIKHPAGKIKEHTVVATPSEMGGGLNDRSTWGATLKRSGAPVEIEGVDGATYVE